MFWPANLVKYKLIYKAYLASFGIFSGYFYRVGLSFARSIFLTKSSTDSRRKVRSNRLSHRTSTFRSFRPQMIHLIKNSWPGSKHSRNISRNICDFCHRCTKIHRYNPSRKLNKCIKITVLRKCMPCEQSRVKYLAKIESYTLRWPISQEVVVE